MPTRLWAIVLPLIYFIAGAAPAQPFRPQVAAQLVNFDRYPAGHPAFPFGVTGLPDLVYANPGGRALTLDLYLPPGPAAAPRPLVVYIHGGLWTDGSKRTSGAFENWPRALAALASYGVVVASIDYRRADEATFPAQIQDVKQALRWLRSKAGPYGIDRSKVLVWGADAGGQLAALAAVSCGAAGLEPQAAAAPPNPVIGPGQRPPPPVDESACAQAAVMWYGVTDLTRLGDMPQANRFLGCTPPDCGPQRRLASPLGYVDRDVPPFLIIHGMEDLVVPVSQAARMNVQIQQKGGSVELVLLPGVGYGFVGPTLDATRDAHLRAWQRTVDFIGRMLRPR